MLVTTGDRPSDTTPEALEAQRAAWRCLGPEGRVRQMIELSETMRCVALDGIAARHPDLDEHGTVRRYIRDVHGVDLDGTALSLSETEPRSLSRRRAGLW